MPARPPCYTRQIELVLPDLTDVAAILVAPLVQLLGCYIEIRSGGCTKGTVCPLKLMAAKHGRRLRLHAATERMRCTD